MSNNVHFLGSLISHNILDVDVDTVSHSMTIMTVRHRQLWLFHHDHDKFDHDTLCTRI